MRIVLGAILALPLLLGCGGGDDDGKDPTPSGPPLSDGEYVLLVCSGINDYLDVLLAKGEDEIRASVMEFVHSMRAVNPPVDATEFHQQFVHYLERGLDDPTILLTAVAPEPQTDVKERLARAESAIPECKSPLFGRTAAEPSPTPGR